MIVLYQSDYFDKKKPDEMFAKEATAFAAQGFSIATFSLDELLSGKAVFHPNLSKDETVLYRGWMLSENNYSHLTDAIAQTGARPYTTKEQYLLAHHIPNWYPLLADLTPETHCFTNLDSIEEDLEKLDWQGFFVKDFVKSLKTSVGSRIESAEQIQIVMTEMKKFRGEIEGGLCVRQIEAIDEASEKRFFVIEGQVYAPDDEQIPDVVFEGASRISSNFFSIDVAKRADGQLRIIEIGDGQVSDAVGWVEDRFASLWRK